eukprot:Rmarinus@m.11310
MVVRLTEKSQQSPEISLFHSSAFSLPGLHGVQHRDLDGYEGLRNRKPFYKPESASKPLELADVVDPKFTERETAQKSRIVAYSSIVTEDVDQRYDSYVSEDLCGRLIESMGFRLFILVVIVLNSVLVGMQTDPSLEKQFTGVFDGVDYVFLTIFIVEIAIKWAYGFVAFWKVGWNVFDFVLVAVSFLGNELTFVSSGRVLRILRVLRAFRTLRSISVLRGLQTIVQTIIRSLPDMGNIFMLLSIVMFIFSVVGVTIFGQDIPEYFGSLHMNMFSLFIMLTQDGWVDIFRKMESRGFFLAGAIYCALFIIVGAFIFVNILSGVTVTNLETAMKEISSERRSRFRSLAEVDDDGMHNAQFIETVPTSAIPPRAWKSQSAVTAPTFAKLSPSMLENYFLILIAIEENLCEFNKLRTTIAGMQQEVKTLNESLEEPATDDESETETVASSGSESTPSSWTGDILSRQIMKDSGKKQEEEAPEVNLEALEQRQRFLEFLQQEHAKAEREHTSQQTLDASHRPRREKRKSQL